MLWILAIIAITVLSQVVGTHFENKFTAGNTPSQQAQNILAARFPAQSGDTADIVFHTATPIPDNRAAIEAVVARVRPLPYVRSVTSPFSAAGAHQIAPRGDIAFAQVQFSTDTADIPTGAVKQVVERGRGPGRTPGSPSSSAGIRSPRRSRRRPGRARASASRPPSSSCCWPSGPWSPWACP